MTALSNAKLGDYFAKMKGKKVQLTNLFKDGASYSKLRIINAKNF